MQPDLKKLSTKRRGFAAMDKAKQRKIAAMGGRKSKGGGRPRKTEG